VENSRGKKTIESLLEMEDEVTKICGNLEKSNIETKREILIKYWKQRKHLTQEEHSLFLDFFGVIEMENFRKFRQLDLHILKAEDLKQVAGNCIERLNELKFQTSILEKQFNNGMRKSVDLILEILILSLFAYVLYCLLCWSLSWI